MAATLDARDQAQVIVNYDEPPTRTPPVLMLGPLAWMRANLFKSVFDTILTLVSFSILIAVSFSLLQWAITTANWFVITNNLRLFLTGTFPVESLWRLEWAARLCAFVVGLTIIAYTRISRVLVMITAVIIALLFVVPRIVWATVPPVTAYVTAGNTTITSGTVSETPQTQIAFIAPAGQAITLRYADIADESSLASLYGFDDRAAAALVNATNNRLEAEQQTVVLQAQLDQGLLTDAQRGDLTDQLKNIQVTDPITATYQLNQTPVDVAVLDGATMKVLTQVSLTADSMPLTFTSPQDGWYVLQKTSSGTALLATTGIYPLHEVDFTRPLPGSGSQPVSQYVRITDGFSTEAVRPQASDQPVPMKVITDNQYLGVRSFGDYLMLFVAPFFTTLAWPLLQLVLMGTLGYVTGIGLMRGSPSASGEHYDPRKRIRGVVRWVWVIWLIALSLLSYGVPGLSTLGVSALIARCVWVGWMYFTGMNLGQVWGRPLLALLTLLGIVQSVMSAGLLDALNTTLNGQNAGALIAGVIGLVVWLVIGLYAARKGHADQWSEAGRRRGLIGAGFIWLILFLLPPLILSKSSDMQNVLPVTDTRLWGGFLLTALLTIVGILASFPIGVLLALGRRSTLPVVHWTCVIYIELVRGVPLITVLFMAQLLVPLVSPALANVDNVFRAMVGLVLFSAAYLAENVRGGLQMIPHEQEEAAKALGLSNYQIILFITLPQALRIVIPALVGEAIALFKDTSLVALVGLIDLTGMSKSVLAQPEYALLQSETYLFISIIYFMFSHLMAWISRRIEASGSGAVRRL